jgi:alpha-L-arabinofuranosidase
METDVNQLGFISHYSPIIHDAQGHCAARPEYYGMLAFAMAGKGKMLNLTVERAGINLSAYATKEDEGQLWITVINKDLARDATVEAALPGGYSSAKAFRLNAPSVESKDHVTLAGAEVSAEGAWTPGRPEKVTTENQTARLLVPHASAVLLSISAKSSEAQSP